MTKIEAVLPHTLRQALFDTALFAPGFPRQAKMAREVAVMRRAISDTRAIRFAYTRADGEASERSVRPLGLYFWGNKWTLAAWCELREDYRSFRPDRMRDVDVLERSFDTTEINLSEFLKRMEEQDRQRPHTGPPLEH